MVSPMNMDEAVCGSRRIIKHVGCVYVKFFLFSPLRNIPWNAVATRHWNVLVGFIYLFENVGLGPSFYIHTVLKRIICST